MIIKTTLMKKSVKTICLLLVLLGISAQSRAVDFNWGIKGGINLSGSNYKGLAENIKYDNDCGFFVGPMAEISFPLGLSIDGSLLYLQRRTHFTNTADYASVNYFRHSLDIPLYLKFTFNPLKIFGIYAGVGPSFTFDFKNDNLTNKLYGLVGEENSQPNGARLINNESTVSMNFTAGVVLFKHLRAGINYRLPFGGTAKETFTEGWNDILANDFSSKSNMWQLVFSVTF